MKTVIISPRRVARFTSFCDLARLESITADSMPINPQSINTAAAFICFNRGTVSPPGRTKEKSSLAKASSKLPPSSKINNRKPATFAVVARTLIFPPLLKSRHKIQWMAHKTAVQRAKVSARPVSS